MEALEVRQFLSVAPTANPDEYEISPDGHLMVDPTMSLAPVVDAPDESTPPKPGETDVIINVIGTERSEAGPVAVGGGQGRYGEINVKEGGKFAITDGSLPGSGWLIVGGHGGYGQMTISGGSSLSTAHWTEAGYYGGFANILLTGTGSSWSTQQFVDIGDNENPVSGKGSGAIFTVADGAQFSNGNWFSAGNYGGWARVLLTGAETKWDNANHFTIGSNGGRGRMLIEDGATLNTRNWAEIGEGAGSHGRVVLRGEGTTWTNANWMEVGGGGDGTLAVLDGASLTSGFIQIGQAGKLVGNGTIRITSELYHFGTLVGVQNGGVINPGASTGVLTIDVDRLQQLATGRLHFDVTGTERGASYDGLDLSGELLADGELFVQFKHGFGAKAGDAFDLVRAGSIEGEFDHVTIRGLSASGELDYKVERVEEDGQVVLRLVILENTLPMSALVDFDPVLGRGVLRNDTDADLDPLYDALSVILVEGPRHGRLALDRDGGLSYVAGPTYAGEDSFRYVADDGVLTSEPARVLIHGEVKRPEPPVARPDAYSVTNDMALVVTKEQGVLANDTGATVAHLVTQPHNGSIRWVGDGSFFYRSEAGFIGTDTFTYRAGNAGGLLSDPVTVTIAVEGANHAPVARPDNKSTVQNTPLVFDAADLLANDTDPDGDALTVTGVFTRATQGTVKLEDGVIAYVPAANFVGTDVFLYQISDGRGGTSNAAVSVIVQRKDEQQLVGRANGFGSMNNQEQFLFFNVQGYRSGDAISARGHLAFFDPSRQISFVSTAIETFSMPDTIHGSIAIFGGRGLLNGREGYRFEATANDIGAPGRLQDTFSIRIFKAVSPVPEGETVYQITGTLDEFGNITVRRSPPRHPTGGIKLVRGADGSVIRRR